MNGLAFRKWTVPLALLGLCGLSFGLLIPWLGFYWDDWPTIWYLHLLGPTGFTEVFNIDRPLLGWLFMATTSILGESTLGWQVFGLITRWLCCLALWAALRSVWPRRVQETAWVVFLFAVYPGFTQQSIAVTYSHAWIILAAFFLSFAAMVWAVRRPRWFWPLLGLSLLLAAFTVFSSEYFFGLEFLRPLALWWLFGAFSLPGPARLQRTARVWAPYLVLLGLFLYWRLFIHETPRGQVQSFAALGQDPFGTLIGLVRTAAIDVFQASVAAWAQVINFPRLASYGQGPTLLYALSVLTGIPLALFFLWKLRAWAGATPESAPVRAPVFASVPAGVGNFPAGSGSASVTLPAASSPPHLEEQPGTAYLSQQAWGKQAFLVGLLALLLGGIPFWMTNLPIGLRFPWDRFTLSLMLGVSLLFGGLLALLPGRQPVKIILLGAALGLAVGFHVQQANLYRREWNAQKDFFWQLVWRAPAIQPGTAILTAELPFTVFSDNSLTAPVNWIYAPQMAGPEMPYLLYAVESRLEAGLPRLEKDQPVHQPYRATEFTGSTSQSLVLFSTPPGCVKVVDPVVDARLPQKPNYIDDLLPLSNPALIQADPASPAWPPEAIFGDEPEHNWCYYFEKADLARQTGDWQQVAALGDIAFKRDDRLYAVNAPELVPFIEGYARVGRWAEAQELTQESYRLTPRMQRMLCAAWQRIAADTPPGAEKQTAVSFVAEKLRCAIP